MLFIIILGMVMGFDDYIKEVFVEDKAVQNKNIFDKK